MSSSCLVCAHCSYSPSSAVADVFLGVWAWGLNLHYLSILKIVCNGSKRRYKERLLTGLLGCPSFNQIPYPCLFQYTSAPSTNLQTRSHRHLTLNRLHPLLLARHPWTILPRHNLGHPTSILPLPPYRLLLHTNSTSFTSRPIPVPHDVETCQHRWNR